MLSRCLTVQGNGGIAMSRKIVFEAQEANAIVIYELHA